jgi:phosphatidylethanolamine/phosphatidyl-N-methylethanolamine N-methyltransferase
MLPRRSSLRIFREFCRNFNEIGSIVPDSRTCIDSLLRRVPFDTAKVIVEFGSASGAVTREIIKRKKPDTIFISFEKNANLHGHLIKSLKGENSFLIHEDAFNCLRVLNDSFGIKEKSVDCIVSTLPCSCFDFDSLVRRSVLPALSENGQFIQYMHSLSLLKGFSLGHFLKKHFTQRHSDFVFRNIPPTFVYTCQNG